MTSFVFYKHQVLSVDERTMSQLGLQQGQNIGEETVWRIQSGHRQGHRAGERRMKTIVFSQKDGFADIEAERFDSGVTIIVTDHMSGEYGLQCRSLGLQCRIHLGHAEAEELGKWLAEGLKPEHR